MSDVYTADDNLRAALDAAVARLDITPIASADECAALYDRLIDAFPYWRACPDLRTDPASMAYVQAYLEAVVNGMHAQGELLGRVLAKRAAAATLSGRKRNFQLARLTERTAGVEDAEEVGAELSLEPEAVLGRLKEADLHPAGALVTAFLAESAVQNTVVGDSGPRFVYLLGMSLRRARLCWVRDPGAPPLTLHALDDDNRPLFASVFRGKKIYKAELRTKELEDGSTRSYLHDVRAVAGRQRPTGSMTVLVGNVPRAFVQFLARWPHRTDDLNHLQNALQLLVDRFDEATGAVDEESE